MSLVKQNQLTERTLTKHEIVSLELASADFLGHGISTEVNITVETFQATHLLHFSGIVIGTNHHRNHEDLSRRQPERPM